MKKASTKVLQLNGVPEKPHFHWRLKHRHEGGKWHYHYLERHTHCPFPTEVEVRSAES